MAGPARSESVHTAKCHIPDAEGISLNSTGMTRHSSSVAVLFYSHAHYRMLFLHLTHLQCAYVSRASIKPPAIQALLPCSILVLACNYLSCFSYPFPKRLRHFFPSLLFLSYHMCFPHTYSELATITIQHTTTVCLGAAIPGAAMETQAQLKEFSGQLVAPHPQPGDMSPEPAVTWGHATWTYYHMGTCHLILLSQCPVSFLIKGRR